MAVVTMDDKEVSAGYSSFPSGLRRSAPATQSQAAQAPPQLPPRPPMQQRPQAFDSDAPRKSPILSKVAIGLAVISLVLNFYLLFTITGIKGELRGLSDSFESIKSKDVEVLIPVKTTLVLRKDIQIGQLLPKNINIPLEFDIPISGSATGISAQGTPVSFNFNNQKLPVKTNVPAAISINSGQEPVLRINEAVPIDTNLRTTIKTSVLYQKEMDDISKRLERIAG